MRLRCWDDGIAAGIMARIKWKDEAEGTFIATVCVGDWSRSVVVYAIELALSAGALEFLRTMAIMATQRRLHVRGLNYARVASSWF